MRRPAIGITLHEAFGLKKVAHFLDYQELFWETRHEA